MNYKKKIIEMVQKYRKREIYKILIQYDYFI